MKAVMFDDMTEVLDPPLDWDPSEPASASGFPSPSTTRPRRLRHAGCWNRRRLPSLQPAVAST